MKHAVRLLAILVGLFAADRADAGAIVSVQGPPGSTDITIKLANTGPTDILSAVFDLSNTKSSAPGNPNLVIELPIFGQIAPAGGTISAATSVAPFKVFSVNFTGFNGGEFSQFSWDPDIASDSSYGAVVGELAGTIVTVNFSGGGTFTGVLRPDGNGNLVAQAIPEPTSIALFGIAMGGAFYGWRRRRSNAA